MGASLLPGLAHCWRRAPSACRFGGGLVVSISSIDWRPWRTYIDRCAFAGGIALNALAEAGIGLFTFIASDEQLRNSPSGAWAASRAQRGR